MDTHFSREVTVFHDRLLPEKGTLVGYSQLINILENKSDKKLPLPDVMAIITKKHQRYDTDKWQVFTIRHKPNNDLKSHLIFALKYEALDLYILKTFFREFGRKVVLQMLEETPTSKYTRRAWFLYEWLLGQKLKVPDLKQGTYVDLVNSTLQYVGPSINSARHRIHNNLPGTVEYCPLIRKTERLKNFIEKGFSNAIEAGLSKRSRELVRRMAAFLLLKDSRASFAIEGEYPPDIRARNWGKVIGQSGKIGLTLEEVERLQHIVIGKKKLKNMGLRSEEGFIGTHDRETFAPLPDHISARAKDLASLMKGLLEANSILQKQGYDPVLTAATIAFGFVFIHPLADGNGRIHRYIIHHILAKMGYTKRGMIFPVSSAIIDRIDEYQDILEHYSAPRVNLIRWEEATDHNIAIKNETIDLYRYFDLTQQAEFLYQCVEDTIEKIIPEELDYLEKYDRLTQSINNVVSLPNTKVDLLIKFLNQNKGKLSHKKRRKYFEELKGEEVEIIEGQYRDLFE